MDLREAMTQGVFVEFRDPLGNSAGTAVYFDWNGRPVPRVGDQLSCRLGHGRAVGPCSLRGRVKSRRFDVQTCDDGRPCVWVHLVVELATTRRKQSRQSPRVCFSDN
jgi:hypothetical protein